MSDSRIFKEDDDELNVSLSDSNTASDMNSSTMDRAQKEMESSIVKKEERVINIIRILVFAAVICSTVAVTLAVYLFATASDTAVFEVEVRLLDLFCNTPGFVS